MLSSTYELLKKIEEGIKHKSFVLAGINEHGLEVRAEITCTKNKQRYYVSHIFTVQEMTDIRDETILVNSFIDRANEQFRLAYESA